MCHSTSITGKIYKDIFILKYKGIEIKKTPGALLPLVIPPQPPHRRKVPISASFLGELEGFSFILNLSIQNDVRVGGA